jgi:predicted DNA-binding transcriptional regulator YafY
MNRSTRLLMLLDTLRGKRRPVTAAWLAETMGVSERTVYRDIAALAELGMPVDGEAGVGYMLRRETFLPPLMFNPDELEALVLGARWVRRQADAGLGAAALSALEKIARAAPPELREQIAGTSLYAPAWDQAADRPETTRMRLAIRNEQKVRFDYRDEADAVTRRVVWPFALSFMDGKELLAAWCELRGALRHFRLDRIADLAALGERYPVRRQELLRRWRAEHNISEDS